MIKQTLGKWMILLKRLQTISFQNRHLILTLKLLALTLAACQPAVLDPPRLATQTAQLLATSTPSPSPVFSAAPTPTADPLSLTGPNNGADHSDLNDTVTLWVNETSGAHAGTLERMAEQFTADSDIQVELILVPPRLLPDLVQTAAISNTLPDLIVHPVEYSLGWAERGILDPQTANEVLNRLDPGTFDPASLEMIKTNGEEGLPAALPSDGWQQLIIYRTDWFNRLGLQPPDTYDRLLEAAQTIYEPDSIISGLVIPTDSLLVTTQQTFEQIAAANGCELVDRKGEILILHPACLEALDFYRQLINNYSPIGVQTDTSALNAYLAGRTGIIMSSPAALPILAGLDEEFRPTCEACSSADYLAKNSGFITRLRGQGDFSSSANFGELTALGITADANREAAMSFAEYWFTSGYTQWLSVDPERKVPMRWSSRQKDGQFLDSWGDTPLSPNGPTLTELFGSETVNNLASNVASSSRWGFDQDQGPLVTTLYEELALSPRLQEMLSGYFTSSQTIIEMYKTIVDLIPDYDFLLDVEPTASPEGA